MSGKTRAELKKTVFSEKSEKDGGSELLLCVIEYPQSGKELFDVYYKTLADAAQGWAREKAIPEIRGEYMSLPEKQRKFHFPRYEYRISCTVEDGERGTEVCAFFSYSHGGKALWRSESRRVWDMENGLIIPPGALNQFRRPKRHKKPGKNKL